MALAAPVLRSSECLLARTTMVARDDLVRRRTPSIETIRAVVRNVGESIERTAAVLHK